jgi:hypothetical protein
MSKQQEKRNQRGLKAKEPRKRKLALTTGGAPFKGPKLGLPIAKRPAAPPKAPKTKCFRCDGTALICDICGESEAACDCASQGFEPTYSDCEDCHGTGK